MSDRHKSEPVITSEQIEHEVALLNRLKSRTTGSDEHEKLIYHIEEQLSSAGLEVRSDELTFTRWAPSGDLSAKLQVAGRTFPIASVFPYSGTTGSGGLSAEMVRLKGPLPAWGKARGKIAVIEVNNFATPFNAVIDTWGGDAAWPSANNSLVPATLAGLGLSRARKAGVRAVIFAWQNMSDDHARGQYLPFTLNYQNIPAAFVSGSAATDLIKHAANSSRAALVLDYTLTPGSTTRTIWATVEGASKPEEAVLVVTHTDGVNAVEENGHIAAVAMARAAAHNRPDRTTIFVFTAGHLRIPAFTSEGQATQRFLSDHPELWKSGVGKYRAVAGLAIEHLGAREFVDDPETNQFRSTGQLEPELLYATTPELADFARADWECDHDVVSRTSKPTPLVQFGEGEPLLQAGIPAISLVTTPLYLLAERPHDETELVDHQALQRQVNNFERLYRRISSADTIEFGWVKKPHKIVKLRAIASLLLSIFWKKLSMTRSKHRQLPGKKK